MGFLCPGNAGLCSGETQHGLALWAQLMVTSKDRRDVFVAPPQTETGGSTEPSDSLEAGHNSLSSSGTPRGETPFALFKTVDSKPQMLGRKGGFPTGIQPWLQYVLSSGRPHKALCCFLRISGHSSLIPKKACHPLTSKGSAGFSESVPEPSCILISFLSVSVHFTNWGPPWKQDLSVPGAPSQTPGLRTTIP